jgi:hypothetical protein
MSGGNITSADMPRNHDGIGNWDLKQCIVYLTVYVFDFWDENGETEMNRGFPFCFHAILKWQYYANHHKELVHCFKIIIHNNFPI